MRRAAAAQLRAKLAKADLAAASAVRSCAPRTARFDTSTIRPKPRPLMPGTTAYAASTANHLAQSMLPREELSNVHACGKPSFSDPAWNVWRAPKSVIRIRAILRPLFWAMSELARTSEMGALSRLIYGISLVTSASEKQTGAGTASLPAGGLSPFLSPSPCAPASPGRGYFPPPPQGHAAQSCRIFRVICCLTRFR